MDDRADPVHHGSPVTDAPSLRDQLAQSIGTCLASDLSSHVQRGAVVIVDETLELLDVAVAVAEDRAQLVRGWIESTLLTRPTAERIAAWTAHPDHAFRMVIVQPYVLVQPSSES